MKWYVEQFYCFGLEKLNILNYILSFIFKRKKENNIKSLNDPNIKIDSTSEHPDSSNQKYMSVKPKQELDNSLRSEDEDD
jgi:hypothetical protein